VIENDLTRIAVALEGINYWLSVFANKNAPLPVDDVQKMDTIEQSISDLENQKRKFLAEEIKEFELKETPALHDTIGTGKTIEEPVNLVSEIPVPELKFEEVSKAFFKLLNDVKDAKGLKEAQELGTSLIREFNNGKPLALATLPKEAYAPLFEKITAAKAEYEPA
jgi:hypothetical protein